MEPVRLMGEGYEPWVECSGERMIYTLPVDSGFVSFCFTFEICQRDLDVLLSDDYRRAVLEITAHLLLQCSTLRGNDRFVQSDFDRLVLNTLHSKRSFLEAFITQIDREHNYCVSHFVKEAMKRRSAKNKTCGTPERVN